MVDVVNMAPAPGLPDLDFGDAVVAAVAPLVADDLGVLAALGASPWGVYSGGAPVVVADTVVDLGYTKSYTVSDYPIEDGGFASYNKVEQPFEARVRLASGGSTSVRQALIDSVEGVIGDLNLYDVVTPDQVYVNANLVREEYRRTATDGGASLVAMDIVVQEVRILSGNGMSNTADPASANQQNGGTVQGQDPTTSQSVQAGTASETVASNAAAASNAANIVTTPLPATLGGGVGGIPVTNPSSGGIGKA